MTKISEENIKCPECGAETTVTVWHTLNVSLDPKAKKTLLKGKINWFRCRECGFEGCLDVPLLYHDMQQQFMVHFFPPQALDQPGFLDKFTPEGKFDFNLKGMSKRFEVIPYLRDIHVVFGMDELLRYVTFRDKLSKLKMRKD